MNNKDVNLICATLPCTDKQRCVFTGMSDMLNVTHDINTSMSSMFHLRWKCWWSFLSLVIPWRVQKATSGKGNSVIPLYEQQDENQLVAAATRVKRKLSVCCQGNGISQKPTRTCGEYRGVGGGGWWQWTCAENLKLLPSRSSVTVHYQNKAIFTN